MVTFAQIGYASGLALLVPLGDLLTRRWLVPAVLRGHGRRACWSRRRPPDIGVLIAVGLIVGAGSVAAQILVPMAASLADDEHRGHVVGMVMSGLLLGILLARTVSGVVAQASSWRVVYVMAAGHDRGAGRGAGPTRLPGEGGAAPYRVRHPAPHGGPAAGHRVRFSDAGPCSGPWASPPSASSGPPWPSCWPAPPTTTAT